VEGKSEQRRGVGIDPLIARIMKLGHREFLARVGLAALGIFFGFLVAEASLYVIDRQKAKDRPEAFSYCRHHAVYGWEHIPNFYGTYEKQEFSYSHTFNGNGLRDRDYPYDKQRNVVRVLFLGDSFTEGLGVKDDEIFTEVLERKLNDPPGSYAYETINAGVVGYSLDQEYLFLIHEGLKYKPDVVFLMLLPYNDVVYTVMDISIQTSNDVFPKPRFVIDEGRLKLTNIPLPDKKLTISTSKSEGLEKIKTVLRQLRTYHLVSDTLRTHFQKNEWLSSLVSKDPKKLVESQHTPDILEVYMNQYNEPTREAWRITEALLQEMNGAVKKKGGTFIVFFIPLPFQIDERESQKFISQNGVNGSDFDFHKPETILKEICDRARITCINPLADFKKGAGNGKPLYYPIDQHWNAEGHRFVADLLYIYLKENLSPFKQDRKPL
jgi:hypothetical protein